MSKAWFKPKRSGWGWYPATWQGWLLLAAYVVLMIGDFLRIDATSHSNSDTLRPWIIHIIGGLIILYAIVRATGEKPRTP